MTLLQKHTKEIINNKSNVFNLWFKIFFLFWKFKLTLQHVKITEGYKQNN